jgi:predicted DNA-binding WGR domain protein
MLNILRRIDTDENTDRWYLVAIQATLLDPVAVVC